MPKMKTGIDSYCFHRYFGEVYPHQTPIEIMARRNNQFIQVTINDRGIGIPAQDLELCGGDTIVFSGDPVDQGTHVMPERRDRLPQGFRSLLNHSLMIRSFCHSAFFFI